MPHLVDGAWHFECVQYLALSFLILPSQVPSPQNGAWMIWNRDIGKVGRMFMFITVCRMPIHKWHEFSYKIWPRPGLLVFKCRKASLVNRFLAFCSWSEILYTNTSIWLSNMHTLPLKEGEFRRESFQSQRQESALHFPVKNEFPVY